MLMFVCSQLDTISNIVVSAIIFYNLITILYLSTDMKRDIKVSVCEICTILEDSIQQAEFGYAEVIGLNYRIANS